MHKGLQIFILILFTVFTVHVFAQTRYNMSNRTVNDCEGILVDSENSKDDNFPTGYAHNEDYYFTICIPGASQITLNFSFFQLEDQPNIETDFVEVFDGPNANSPKLGHWISSNSPGSVSSTGECITIYFHSDDSRTQEGFQLTWSVVPPDPIPPVIQPIPNVPCNSTSVVINFDQPIPCNQLVPANFTFAGPSGSAVSAVTPINCVNGSATSARLDFNSPLDEGGTYTIVFDFFFLDVCKRPFRFQISATFNIVDCPLEVDIVGDSLVCLGNCVTLTANVTGGNPANYQYVWQPGGATTASISACPTVDQVYTVTVTDGASQPASATHTVRVLQPPQAGNDLVYCRFDPDVTLIGAPAGGTWTGPGIINGTTFRPRNAGPGVHTVTYSVAPIGCSDAIQITVHPVSAGTPQAACRGSATFTLTGTPPGGTWTGTGITAGGTFDPVQAGVFQVTYTEPNNGCQATQTVTVVDSIEIPPLDSMVVCVNKPAFAIPFSPAGGTWTGTGINANNGIFNPNTAGQGVHTLTYRINGCSETTNAEVNVINAGVDILVCPSAAPFLLTSGTPAGGIWTGLGVTDNGDGTFTYTPATVKPDTIIALTYSLDSCSDAIVVYQLNTTVTNDTLKFCPGENTIKLDPAFYTPNIPGGVWSGAGLVQPDSLNPRLLGPGMNYIYYEYGGNGCRDSLSILIKPKPVAQNDVIICPQAPDFNLTATPASGTWSGFGITDPVQGTFSPAFTGVGFFDAVYALNGCMDTTRISVQTTSVSFNGLQPYYCLNNNNVTLNGNPAGGTFTGPGVSGNSFNPNIAGSGIHEIVYAFGTGNCIVRDTQTVKVLVPIDFNFIYPTHTLCYGDSILIRVKITGGDSTKKFHYTWNPDKGDTSQIYVKPTAPTTYSLTVDEGCSVPRTKDFFVDVHEEIRYNYSVGPPVCFGLDNWGHVEILNTPRPDYTLSWNTDPPTNTDSVFTTAGKYRVTMQNIQTGCKIVVPITIPYHPFIDAKFIKTPEQNCVSVLNPKFNFIDLSAGGDTGYWDFGDTIIPYIRGMNPEKIYKDTGDYHVVLYIINDQGCEDSATIDLCVEPAKVFNMPNAFSPNGDGDNDVFPPGEWRDGKFIPVGYGITDYNMAVFDRWGHLIYETDRYGTPWNGHWRNVGALLKGGIYVYKMQVFYGPRDIREVVGHMTIVR